MTQKIVAHIEAALTAMLGTVVAVLTTHIGQGAPPAGVQAQVGAVVGAFVWLVSLWHRFRPSPGQGSWNAVAAFVRGEIVPALVAGIKEAIASSAQPSAPAGKPPAAP